MKKILLTTYDYPFGCGEAFLESEIPILARSFERVYIVPVRRLWVRTDLSESRKLPDGVEVLLPQRYGAALLVHSIVSCLPLILAYFAICKRVRFGRIGTGIKSMAALIVRRMRWAFVDVEIARLQGQCQADLGYAYWKSGCAYPVARLKESGSINQVIARAHHHDLYPNLSPEGYNPFDDYLKCQLDSVFSISNDGIDTLNEIGYRNDQIHLSRLGVAKPEHVAAESADGVLRLISVSRVEHIKRLDLLVAALKLASSSMRIEWTHFGTGSQFAAIKESLASLPGNVNACLRGEVRNVEVLAHYLNQPVDILINVSASEGVPVSIMEALSFGVPCIATDVGATREIVNAKNGCLLNENVTAAEVMDAVIDLERRIESAESLQPQALSIWDEHFNRDKNFIDFAEQISK